jgi:type IV pilus assembly protein PilB
MKNLVDSIRADIQGGSSLYEALGKHPVQFDQLFRNLVKAGVKIYEAVGCADCNEGYKGRLGIYQVMPMTEAIQKIILEGGNAMQIADTALRSGVNDLRKSALLKAKNGITSLAEINRVTKD